MVGIAAGVAKSELEVQIYGDVIVPDIVWNYSAGKFVSPEKAEIKYGNLGFLPRSTSEHIPEEIMPYLINAVRSPENPAHAYIGPMACGSTVVATQELLEKQVYTQYQQTAGLDMESYAVVYAANHSSNPRPIPIIAKMSAILPTARNRMIISVSQPIQAVSLQSSFTKRFSRWETMTRLDFTRDRKKETI